MAELGVAEREVVRWAAQGHDERSRHSYRVQDIFCKTTR
jgi:hypothetical protein